MSVIYSLLEIRDENVVLFDSIDQMLAYIRERYDNMFVFHDQGYRDLTAFRIIDLLNQRGALGVFVFVLIDSIKTVSLKIQKHDGVYNG